MTELLRRFLAAIISTALAFPLGAARSGLTSETIAADLNAVNGSISYAYDPVGNRLQKTSTLAGLPVELQRERSIGQRHLRRQRQHHGVERQRLRL